MTHVIDFINLSSGLVWLQHPDGPNPKSARYLRISSTACEQKLWSFILEDLPHEFLLNAAQGNTCRVWDASARKDVSRALYQGLPWIRYALERRWFGREVPAVVRMHNAADYFKEQYRLLSDRAKKKLDYVGKYLVADTISLDSRCMRTGLDGKYEELAACLESQVALA